jgi:hypothetical protein
MLFGSLLIDIFAPTQGTDLSWYLFLGTFITFSSVAFNQSVLERRINFK